MRKRNPNGFVALCQCGVCVGALDARRTDRKDMGKILGEWLSEGCTVEPRFDGTWSVQIESCRCDAGEKQAGQ